MIAPGAGTSYVRMRRTETSTSSSQPGRSRQSSRISVFTSASSPLTGPASTQAAPSKFSRFSTFQ